MKKKERIKWLESRMSSLEARILKLETSKPELTGIPANIVEQNDAWLRNLAKEYPNSDVEVEVSWDGSLRVSKASQRSGLESCPVRQTSVTFVFKPKPKTDGEGN